MCPGAHMGLNKLQFLIMAGAVKNTKLMVCAHFKWVFKWESEHVD